MTGRRGDEKTGRMGDLETGRGGDAETAIHPSLPFKVKNGEPQFIFQVHRQFVPE
jgi:hypothetical protein